MQKRSYNIIFNACLKKAGMLLFFLLLPANSVFMQSNENHPYQEQQEAMVRNQIIARGIKSKTVTDAMRKVPRHMFVPYNTRTFAYNDQPLPIGHNQTISQPYIVAYMTEALDAKAGDKVLEIGTGSGYQAAILAEMGIEVYTIEIIPELAETAKRNLKRTGYNNVNTRLGDGYAGWPDEAPFDAIIITAAPETIPQALVEQLKTGGTMILPVGPRESTQSLKKVVKRSKGIRQTTLLPVRFVPMIRSYN
ncbi:protein-L-isoaspartate(D-aspartate) O-methyltransferase [Marinilabilia salmonicolor]|uniref:protein-L-isoaspartate(D-aspartate) O-methyltransferase n=1 Tax=Marinilabilia salmonicolor TaxID=989 RepID=UPI00029A082F|nr:protein-L-isoaspartate(D-aspartate) O-methyltransferase [Marinilabilia salmonicolor]